MPTKHLLVLTAVAAFAVVPSAAAEHPHRDEVATIATAMAVAEIASDNCRDIYVRVGGIEDLRDRLHITSADDMALLIEVRTYAKGYTDQIAKGGVQAWCDDVLNYFGPGGSMMSGLLKRQ